MPGTEEYKRYNLWGRGKIDGQDHNFRIKNEDEDRNMLGVMSSGGYPRTQEREALSCRISWPVAKMFGQARLMVLTTM